MDRLKVIKYGYFLFILLIILRLAFWQILQSDNLNARADDQRVSKKEVYSPRGQILFSDGSMLVSNEPSYLVFAQPKVVANKPVVARQLAEIFAQVQFGKAWEEQSKLLSSIKDLEDFNRLKLDQTRNIEDSVNQKLSSDLFWISLGQTVSFEVKEQIEKLNINGVGFDTKSKRFYPEGSSSAHLLGFVSSDSYGVDKGYFGLEGFYDGELRSKKGLLTQEKDAHGLPILIGKYDLKLPTPGKTLLLNIDHTVQTILEMKLKLGIEKYGAKSASAIIMDPKTGNVLAMAAYPNYDPAVPGDFPKESFKNPITIDAYEPGSTFKVLVMAAAINEGLVTPETICNICAGPLSVGGYVIRTWNNQYGSNSSMADVIIHSDNTGMVFVSRKLGAEKMYQYIHNFGFGNLTGIDLQDEVAPQLRDQKEWKEIDVATASFGQGISVTALQLINAVATIANGGKLMEPHIVAALRSDEGAVTIQPRVLGQPISPKAAALVKDMMVRAVDEGEAKFSKPKGFKIAGKTGTAQIPVAGHYDATKTIASFVGFAPADDPKFVMLVRYDQPSTSIYGAETAAPTFFDIAKELFLYYGIAPSQ